MKKRLLGNLSKKSGQEENQPYYDAKPSNIHISITYRCSGRCLYCDYHPMTVNDEPELNKWKDAIRKLVGWLGACRIDFAGGEPLDYPGFLDILALCRELGVFTVITTNGYRIDDKMAQRLIELGVGSINVSLESIEPEIHNRLRNLDNAHGMAQRAIDALDMQRRKKQADTNITIASVMTRLNIEQLPRLAELAESRGMLFNLQVLYQNFGAPFDMNWYKKSELFPDDLAQVDRILDKLISMREAGCPINNSIAQLELMKRYYRDPNRKTLPFCRVGENSLVMNPQGDMMLCFFTDPIGNIHHDEPKVVWHSEKAANMRHFMARCQRNCDLLNCAYQTEERFEA